mmetsp:Transcript_98788/g.274947  ORF Transcript_98788/g.274947 Transcript_98788/m.274947 type:complete len:242 (+) Transcript_98788:1757-2482(+)
MEDLADDVVLAGAQAASGDDRRAGVGVLGVEVEILPGARSEHLVERPALSGVHAIGRRHGLQCPGAIIKEIRSLQPAGQWRLHVPLGVSVPKRHDFQPPHLSGLRQQVHTAELALFLGHTIPIDNLQACVCHRVGVPLGFWQLLPVTDADIGWRHHLLLLLRLLGWKLRQQQPVVAHAGRQVRLARGRHHALKLPALQVHSPRRRLRDGVGRQHHVALVDLADDDAGVPCHRPVHRMLREH